MDLHSPIETVPGIGPSFAQRLKSHGILRIEQLLSFYPMRYVDFTDVTPMARLTPGSYAAVKGTVISVAFDKSSRRHMSLVKAIVSDDTGSVKVIWFNQYYLTSVVKKGAVLGLYGLVAQTNEGLTLRSPEIQTNTKSEPDPHYSEKSGLKSGHLKRFVRQILPLAKGLDDPLPAEIRQSHHLYSLSEAITKCHHPNSMKEVWAARMRLAVDELWSIMVAARLMKEEAHAEVAPAIKTDEEKLKIDCQAFPFELTESQKKAVVAVVGDMAKSFPMRRLLNGDVGSGKTVVAFLAARAVMRAGYHVVMMAPTTVLAGQHYNLWHRLFPESHHFLVTAAVCRYNGQKISRQKLLQQLAVQNQAFICGTQAVFQSDANLYDQTGLVVVDEQHRFGVMQRAHFSLAKQTTYPHVLSMSATPIPRTAALVLYGDLDVSYLPEKPGGRLPVVTRLISNRGREMMYKFVDQLITKGQRVYVICPIIEPAEESPDQFVPVEERKAVKEEYEKLRTTIFAHRRLGLLHGKMKAAEKEETLAKFRDGELDILISTTVIEVGVDVPEATVMIIEGAEYFGLAQLHQLRGRVGRGLMQSYCFLCAMKWTPAVKERLYFLAQHEDGFALAEKDLAMRGPGEFWGTLQAGYAPFRLASISNRHLVEMAQSITAALLDQANQSPGLKSWLEKHRQQMRIE